jgi:glucose-6-phosphate 1-dehydrogenase
MKRPRATMHHVVTTLQLDTQPVLKRGHLIDHYSVKWPVHNMVFFRFANAFLKPFSNRNHDKSV